MTTVSLSAFQETVARAIDKYPAEKGRIERGAQLIATGHVDQISTDAFAVRSQTDERVYIVDNTGCPCVDAQRHPELTCKHCWSVTLLVLAAERARRLNVGETGSPTSSDATEMISVASASETVSSFDLAESARTLLARLVEERAYRGRIVAAEGGRALDDERCRLLDESIARVRANLAPVTFRETAA